MRNLFLFIFISTVFATRLLVPEEYATIQEGIDAAATGDTVLVNDGWYYENLEINNSIVLASYAIFDDLDDWVTDEDGIYYGQWIVANSHIQNTHIIGSSPVNEDYGSCILITSEDECISPEVIGFTIRNGQYEEDINSPYYQKAGGISILGASNATLSDVHITENTGFNGGGIYCFEGSSINLSKSVT